MAITNATRLSDFGSGIGTAGAVLKVDNTNQRVGIGTTDPRGMLQVGTAITMNGNTGVITATSFEGSGANLTGVDLTGANLTGVNLTGANISNANFEEATLIACNFENTNLTGCDFSQAKLVDCKFNKFCSNDNGIISVNLLDNSANRFF